MTQRGNSALKTGDSSPEERPSVELENSQELSAVLWRDMPTTLSTNGNGDTPGATDVAFLDTAAGMSQLFGQTDRSNQPKPLELQGPDGRVVIDPQQFLADRRMMQQLMDEGALTMDDAGNFDISPQWLEQQLNPAPSGSAVAEAVEKDRAFSTRREDGSLAGVQSRDAETGTVQQFSINEQGQIESLTTTDESGNGKKKTVRFNEDGQAVDGNGRVDVERSADGKIESFTYTNGDTTQEYLLDDNGDVRYIATTKTTADGGRIESRDRFEDGESIRHVTNVFNADGAQVSHESIDDFEHLTQKIDPATGTVMEEVSRSQNRYSVMTVHPDRTERVSVNADGLMTTNVTFPDGSRTFSQRNLITGDTSYSRTEADGSMVSTEETSDSSTITRRDQYGNWHQMVTDKKTGFTTETIGDARGQIGKARHSRGA